MGVSSQESSSPPLNPQCQQELQLPLKHLPQELHFQLLFPLKGSPRGSSLPSRPSSSQQPLLNKLSDPSSLASNNSLSNNSPSSSSSPNKQLLFSSRTSNLSSSSQEHSQALCS